MFRLFITIAVCGVLVGCGPSISTDYHKLGLVDVSGQVLMEGDPLANAYIIFEADDTTYSFAKTNGNGAYKLMLNTEKSGIVPGEKTVRIRLSGAFGAEGGMLDGNAAGDSEGGGEGMEMETDANPGSTTIDELPESYHRKSKIKVVVPSSSSTFDFDLKADGSTTQPSS